MADLDERFSPLPALTDPVDPLDELTLQDALADQVPVSGPTGPPAPLGRAPAYDFIQHQLLPGAAGGPLMTRGVATLATWVEKCIRTRRGENPAVDPSFGCDLLAEDVLEEGVPFDPAATAEFAAAVSRALLVHPRITSVEDVTVDGGLDDDLVTVSFHVTTDGDDLSDLTFNRLQIGA